MAASAKTKNEGRLPNFEASPEQTAVVLSVSRLPASSFWQVTLQRWACHPHIARHVACHGSPGMAIRAQQKKKRALLRRRPLLPAENWYNWGKKQRFLLAPSANGTFAKPKLCGPLWLTSQRATHTTGTKLRVLMCVMTHPAAFPGRGRTRLKMEQLETLAHLQILVANT